MTTPAEDQQVIDRQIAEVLTQARFLCGWVPSPPEPPPPVRPERTPLEAKVCGATARVLYRVIGAAAEDRREAARPKSWKEALGRYHARSRLPPPTRAQAFAKSVAGFFGVIFWLLWMVPLAPVRIPFMAIVRTLRNWARIELGILTYADRCRVRRQGAAKP